MEADHLLVKACAVNPFDAERRLQVEINLLQDAAMTMEML